MYMKIIEIMVSILTTNPQRQFLFISVKKFQLDNIEMVPRDVLLHHQRYLPFNHFFVMLSYKWTENYINVRRRELDMLAKSKVLWLIDLYHHLNNANVHVMVYVSLSGFLQSFLRMVEEILSNCNTFEQSYIHPPCVVTRL